MSKILIFLLNKKCEEIVIETFCNSLQFCEDVFIYISECKKFDE